MTTTETAARPSYAGALLRYRVMAYATGIALVTATVLYILVHAAGEDGLDTANGISWVAHGYLFLIYVITALHLGIKLRWPFIRLGLIVISGTIPLMSFVAERYVTRIIQRESVSAG